MPGGSPVSKARILKLLQEGFWKPYSEFRITTHQNRLPSGAAGFLLWRCRSSTSAKPGVGVQTSTHPDTHSFISFVHSDHRRAPTTYGVLVDVRPGAPRTSLKVRLDCPELSDNARWLGSPRKKATVMSGGLSAGAAVCKPPERGGGVHFMLTHEAGLENKAPSVSLCFVSLPLLCDYVPLFRETTLPPLMSFLSPD